MLCDLLFEENFSKRPKVNGYKDEKPVLIVHWTDDTVVPVSYSDKAQSTYKNSTLKKIKWWGHWFEGKDFDTSVKYIWEFLESLWAL